MVGPTKFSFLGNSANPFVWTVSFTANRSGCVVLERMWRQWGYFLGIWVCIYECSLRRSWNRFWPPPHKICPFPNQIWRLSFHIYVDRPKNISIQCFNRPFRFRPIILRLLIVLVPFWSKKRLFIDFEWIIVYFYFVDEISETCPSSSRVARRVPITMIFRWFFLDRLHRRRIPDWHPTVLTITQSHIHFSNQNNPPREKMRWKRLVNLIWWSFSIIYNNRALFWGPCWELLLLVCVALCRNNC